MHSHEVLNFYQLATILKFNTQKMKLLACYYLPTF